MDTERITVESPEGPLEADVVISSNLAVGSYVESQALVSALQSEDGTWTELHSTPVPDLEDPDVD